MIHRPADTAGPNPFITGAGYGAGYGLPAAGVTTAGLLAYGTTTLGLVLACLATAAVTLTGAEAGYRRATRTPGAGDVDPGQAPYRRGPAA